MRLQDILYPPSLLEQALETEQALLLPAKGFHTLYEREVQLEDSTRALVAYVEGGARCGDRYTIAIHGDLCGWTAGFRLPVPIRPQGTLQLKDFRGLVPEKLLLIGEVPGFSQDGTHEQGWYSRSILVREIPPGTVLAPGTRVFLLREGVYSYFPDKSIRLMPYASYFPLAEVIPDFQQGHLLIWKEKRDIRGDEYISVPEEVKFAIGDHRVVVAEYEFYTPSQNWVQGGRIEHPELETLILPTDDSGPDWAVPGYTWQYLPGNDRPFKKR